MDEKVKAIQSDVPIFVANMSEEILGDNGTFSLVSFLLSIYPSPKKKFSTYPSDMLELLSITP